VRCKAFFFNAFRAEGPRDCAFPTTGRPQLPVPRFPQANVLIILISTLHQGIRGDQSSMVPLRDGHRPRSGQGHRFYQVNQWATQRLLLAAERHTLPCYNSRSANGASSAQTPERAQLTYAVKEISNCARQRISGITTSMSSVGWPRRRIRIQD